MEKIVKAIQSNDPRELNTLLANGDGPSMEMLHKLADQCIDHGANQCLKVLLSNAKVYDSRDLALKAKKKNDPEAFKIVTSNLSVSNMLGLMNFAPQQYEIAIQLVEKLSKHYRFVQSFKEALNTVCKGSDLARNISNAPVTLNTNIVNPYEGEYFPGRENIIEDVCGKVCFPGGLQRNIICFCGKDHFGKTALVKKITTLSSYCNQRFDGIVVVEANNNHYSNVEEPIMKALGKLTGNSSLEQLLNGNWLLTYILESTGEKVNDAKQSQLVVECLETLVEKSGNKLRVILRLPHVSDIEFLKKGEKIDLVETIPELSSENFYSAVDRIFGRNRDENLENVLQRHFPRTHYFLFELKKRGKSGVQQILRSKGDFVEEIGLWRGAIQTFQPQVLSRMGTADFSEYADTPMPSTPGGGSSTTSGGPYSYGRSATMPNLGSFPDPRDNSYNERAGAFSPNSYLGYNGGYDDYTLRLVVTLPELSRSPHYNENFHKSVDVTFVLLIEQYFKLLNEQQVQFLNSNDVNVFRYEISTSYGKAMEMLKIDPRSIRSALISEIRNRAQTQQLYAKLEKCLGNFSIELLELSAANHRSSSYRSAQDFFYNDRTPALSPHARSEYHGGYDYGDAYYSPGPAISPALSDASIMNARKKKKTQNRSNSKNYRARQDLVEKKRAAVQALLGDRLIPDEKMIYLRGPKVLFIPSKSPNSLTKIADFVKEIDEDPKVTIKRAALPLSRKNEFQLKGFLAYLEMENEEQVNYVRTEIYEKKYKQYFQKCVAAEFKKSFKNEKSGGFSMDPSSPAYTPGDTPSIPASSPTPASIRKAVENASSKPASTQI